MRLQKGFTLIELLIVIAILGILATAVLVAINPLEQFARARDAGRKSTIDQFGHALQAYYTTQNAAYPAADTAWMTTLQTSGELKLSPSNPTAVGYTTGCGVAGFAANGYCYLTNGTEAVVYARAESQSEKIKSTGTGTACATIAWMVWSSADGKTGLVCQAADPPVGITGLR